MRERMLFDDFAYRDAGALAAHGWSIRTRAGGPGADAASWSAANVSLVADPDRRGNRLLRLSATTDGTPRGTSQAEVATAARRFGAGTYAARVRFSDVPLAGAGGDRVVQAFFAIGEPPRTPEPDYSEVDFEYLPNGGWGNRGPALLATSWAAYGEEPPVERRETTARPASHAGWHTLVIHIAAGAVCYLVDGQPLARHDGHSYPGGPMAVSFNLWLQRDGLVGARTPRTYGLDVDWVFHEAAAVLTPRQIEARVDALRASAGACTSGQ